MLRKVSLRRANDARIHGRRRLAPSGRRRFGHAAQNRNREDRPPHGDAQKGEARAEVAAQGQDHRYVDAQQQATAEITDGVSPGRNAILILLTRYVGQQGVIEDVGRGKADSADYEERRSQHPVARADEHQQAGADSSHANGKGEKLLLATDDVGDRSENWRQHGNDDQRCTQRHLPQRGRLRGAAESAAGHLAVIHGQHGGENRRRESGVRPVIESPRPYPAAVLVLTDADVAGDDLARHAPSPRGVGRLRRRLPTPQQAGGPLRSLRRTSAARALRSEPRSCISRDLDPTRAPTHRPAQSG